MSKFKLTQTAAEVQGILNNCNGLKSDAEGNLTVSKNLGVDGKLKLKSLVSASNPDGDITKELGGGGAIAQHKVFFQNTGGDCRFFFFALSSTAPYRDNLQYELGIDNINNWFLHGKERDFLATGYLRAEDGKIKPIVYVHMAPRTTSIYIYYLDTTNFLQKHIQLPNGQFEVGESIAITTAD